MNLTYLVVILVAIASIVGFQPRAIPSKRKRLVHFPTIWLACACALNLICFAASLFVDNQAIARQLLIHPQPFTSWHVWDENVAAPAWVSDCTLAISCVQSLALLLAFVVLRSAKVGTWTRLLVGTTSFVMLGLAITSRTLKSADLYAYASIARLGFGSYRPSGAYHDGFAAANFFWGTPIVPNVYGPVWTALSHGLYVRGIGITQLMLELRAIEIFAFVVIAIALWAMKYGPEYIAVFLMNGAVIDQFVRDGHNDLFAIALVLVAFVVVRFPAVSVLLVAAAIAVKISFVAVGATVFVSCASRRLRTTYLALSGLLGAGGAILWTGLAYPEAILGVSRRVVEDGVTHGIHVLAIVLVAFASFVIVWYRRSRFGISYAYIALGLLPLPWYVIWGLPNAMRAGCLGAFLIALPFVLDLLSTSYAFTTLRAVAFFIIMASASFVIVRALRSGRVASSVKTARAATA